jgi:alpha-1,2-mannosyltransferase
VATVTDRTTRRDRAVGRAPTVRRVLGLAGLAVAVTVFLALTAVRRNFFDLQVYYGAINYWAHGAGVLYDYLEPKSTYGFTYPPFAALAMLPMAVTPWVLTVIVNATACAAATAVLVYWLVDPVARRQGWSRWFAFGVALCLAAAFEPLRETFLFGQANMLLVFLVGADLLLLVSRGSRWAGVGIGLATAIKLTPGIFLVYLLVTRRWRAAAVAAGTATAATLLAAVVAPDVSQVFWTDALWNTDRVGQLAFISNQSLNGAVARLNRDDPSTALWLLTVVAVLVVWVVRVRRAGAAGDELTGFALTGVVGCLVSPVTWVHHLVWVGPALLLLLDSALATPQARHRRRLLVLLGVAYALLCSKIVWAFGENWWSNPPGWLLSNSYVWISLALLVALPVRYRVSGGDGTTASDAGAGGGATAEGRDREFALVRP